MTSSGQGSISISQKQKAPGPPFVSNSAYNGLSVDTVTGQIVLGNDVGDPGNPAQLVSNREIQLTGNLVQFIDSVFSSTLQITGLGWQVFTTGDKYGVLNFGTVELGEDTVGGRVSLFKTTASQAIMQLTGSAPDILEFYSGGVPQFGLQSMDFTNRLVSVGDTRSLGNQTLFTIDDTNKIITASFGGNRFLELDNGANAYSIGDINAAANNTFVQADDANALIRLTANNGFQTSDPGFTTGAAPWLLGDVVVAAAALDATQYLEVMVNGVMYKLALIV